MINQNLEKNTTALLQRTSYHPVCSHICKNTEFIIPYYVHFIFKLNKWAVPY